MYRFFEDLKANRVINIMLNALFFHGTCLSFMSSKYQFYVAVIFALCFKLTSKYSSQILANNFKLDQVKNLTEDEMIYLGVGAVVFLLYPKELIYQSYSFTMYTRWIM